MIDARLFILMKLLSQSVWSVETISWYVVYRRVSIRVY